MAGAISQGEKIFLFVSLPIENLKPSPMFTKVLYRKFRNHSWVIMPSMAVIFVCLAIIIPMLSQSQSCLPQGITFITQSQIDSFQIMFPGCTEIEGDLRIYGGYWESIQSLSELNVLTAIGGDLHISDCDSLSSLFGLNNITTIGGSLEILSNPLLIDLNDLENLSFIGGDFAIANNEILSNIIGLSNLISINGKLQIMSNPALLSLQGLDNLEDTTITSLWLINNSSLSNCTAQSICNYLSNPGGTVDIYYNASGCDCPSEIANNCGFTLSCLPYGNYHFHKQLQIDSFFVNYVNCSVLSGNIKIEGNDVRNLNGLSVLDSIDGNLRIKNTSLNSFDGLENLTSVSGYFDITFNDSLMNVSGLDNLSYIGQEFDFKINDNIITFDGFNSLTTVGGYFRFWWNNNLTEITGFDNLTTIDGVFGIDSNPLLSDFSGFSNVSFIGDGIGITANHSLTNLSGLEGLTTLESHLVINSNKSLTSLSGLENITSINGSLNISVTDSLTNLLDLSNLRSLGGNLAIHTNSMLISLTGLDSIDANSIEGLHIYNNQSLATCHVVSICNYLANPGGYIVIHDNASGCYNQAEVEEACMIKIPEISVGESIFIFPNPTSREITISGASGVIDEISIYSKLGQRVIHEMKPGNTIDVSCLPQGLYIVEVVWNEYRVREKLIVQ